MRRPRLIVAAPTSPRAQRIAVYVDESRDPSPMNAGQRMARIAVGSALENLVRTTRKNALDVELEVVGVVQGDR